MLNRLVPAPVRRALGAVVPNGRRHRRSWVGSGHAHIEVRGTDDPRATTVARRVTAALRRLDDVHWAEFDVVTGRVMVAFDGDALGVDDLIDVVASVEEAHGLSEERFAHEQPDHPADREPLQRQLVAIGADVCGLGVSGVGQLLRVVPFPAEVAGLISLADGERHVHGLLETRLGRGPTDLLFAAANAVSQALAQGPLGLLVDIAHRANLVGEILARQAVWERREPGLCATPHAAPERRSPVSPGRDERPVAVPPGPVERYADRSGVASLAAFAVTLGATRDPRRAADVLLAGIPKAAQLGRDAFAAQFDRVLAARGVVVMNPSALRRLDRIDTVVVDADLLSEPLGDHLRVTAGAAGLELVVAAHGRSRARDDDERRIAASRLVPGIRRLQRDGRTVALVSTSHVRALHAADLGIGMERPGRRAPWGADVICGPGLADAILVLDATRTAREVSRRSALLALAGSSTGSIWALTGPRRGAARRSLLPINAAAMLAIGTGAWVGWTLGNRRMPRAALDQPWHELEPDSALGVLGSRADGLLDQEARRRWIRDEEENRPPPAPTLWRATVTELANPLTPLLGVGAAMSAAVGSVSDAALVGGVVVVNALVSGVQQVRTETAITRLSEDETAAVRTRRGGTTVDLAPSVLVVGDVIELDGGDLVPADCRILEASGLEVDESALTGESLPVAKQVHATPGMAVADRRCMLFAETTVAVGHVVAVVVATGTATEAGRSLAAGHAPASGGVEARLATLTRITVPVTVASGAAIAGLGLLRRRSPRRAIGAGVSLTVAAVPEGLPLLATTAQHAAARRLAARNALVRNPRAMEALGRADTLCFDKTGTLTEGRIALRHVSDGTAIHELDALDEGTRRVLAAALRASPAAAEHAPLHDATDQAVVDGARAARVSEFDGLSGWQRLDELAFDSSRGYHATLGRRGACGWLSVKGAPEVVLPACRRWRGADRTRDLDTRVRSRIEYAVERLARTGSRVLAVAERSVDAEAIENVPLDELELVGLLGFADRARASAASAIADLRRAGVRMAMITGDHPSTAEAIAAELGLVNGGSVLSGTELDDLDDAALDAKLAATTVFARVAPAQKVRIVEAYQRAGRIVAMTGDGSNDAPALRLANAGIALGGRASAAAKQAADVVVVDERVETIIDTIVEGRAMWSSVRDALAILIGGNLGEVAFTLGGALVTGTSPLNARQLLLVNLLTDMLPALAIALRPPTGITPEQLIDEGPDRSLGTALTRDVVIRATTTAAGALGAWVVARASGTPARARTVGLVALVGTQLGQTVIAGGSSPAVLGSSIASAGALVAVVQTPGLSQFFGCHPLGPIGWTTAIGAAGVATAGSLLVPPAARVVTRSARAALGPRPDPGLAAV